MEFTIYLSIPLQQFSDGTCWHCLKSSYQFCDIYFTLKYTLCTLYIDCAPIFNYTDKLLCNIIFLRWWQHFERNPRHLKWSSLFQSNTNPKICLLVQWDLLYDGRLRQNGICVPSFFFAAAPNKQVGFTHSLSIELAALLQTNYLPECRIYTCPESSYIR